MTAHLAKIPIPFVGQTGMIPSGCGGLGGFSVTRPTEIDCAETFSDLVHQILCCPLLQSTLLFSISERCNSSHAICPLQTVFRQPPLPRSGS